MDWLEKASAIVNAAREKHGEQWKTCDGVPDMVNALTKPGDAGKKLKDIRERQKGNATGHSPLKYLLNGRPGLGKSALAAFLQHLLGCHQWNTTKLNGTQCKIETVEEIHRQLSGSNLFGDWRLLWIDEADAIPPVAQVRFLTLLDDLPSGVAIVCTSNCKLRDFEERFQTRFQAF